jgi:hypothetical protein
MPMLFAGNEFSCKKIPLLNQLLLQSCLHQLLINGRRPYPGLFSKSAGFYFSAVFPF